MRGRLIVGAGCAALALSLAAPWAAQAQTAAKTLNGDAPAKGTMMSRDELRACLKDQAAQKARSAELDQRRTEVEAEIADVRRQKEAVQAERDAYAAKAAEVQAFKEKVKQHGERLALYNQRVKEFRENPPKPADLERERGQIEGEADALAKADAAIKAEAAQWTATMEPARAALSEHTQAQQAAAATATEHNRVFNEAVAAQQEQLAAWKQRCGNRPYREADEKAISAEK
ncbi:hypothetical protein [Ideonella sp.]|uniref:hypothetical protein n=1 Tax=Ideonella sp. TaxID=1929293 RepID=UPI0035B4EE2F